MLKAENITWRNSKGRAVLENLSIDIDDGEFIGIKGGKKSGKSSLFFILGMMSAPDSGQLFLDKRDCTVLNTEERKLLLSNQVGLVFQSDFLIDNLTIKENLELPFYNIGKSGNG